MLAKLTSKNQITIPKAIIESIGSSEYYEVRTEDGSILLTPVNPRGAASVRTKLEKLGISESDIHSAVKWARGKQNTRK
ncbi:MAG: AbrB/MazE/SpoVT family DNA-binding domain-containing protein [Candidatus Sumerlaeaceae bacterium]